MTAQAGDRREPRSGTARPGSSRLGPTRPGSDLLNRVLTLRGSAPLAVRFPAGAEIRIPASSACVFHCLLVHFSGDFRRLAAGIAPVGGGAPGRRGAPARRFAHAHAHARTCTTPRSMHMLRRLIPSSETRLRVSDLVAQRNLVAQRTETNAWTTHATTPHTGTPWRADRGDRAPGRCARSRRRPTAKPGR